MLKYLLRLRGKKGFTLIELIVVLVILAVLAAAAVPAVMGYVQKAKIAQHYAEMRAIVVATKAALTLTCTEISVGNGEASIIYNPGSPTGSGKEKIDKVFTKYFEDAIGQDLDKNRIWIWFSGIKENGSFDVLQIRFYLSADRQNGYNLLYKETTGAGAGTIEYCKGFEVIE